MALAPGTKLGPYEVLAPLGAGGMGEVWRARDTRLGREVAVKVLPEHLSDDRAALARFETEARAVAALSHPNILAIHDFGRAEGTAYAVTELLEGETLRSALRRRALPPRRALEVAARLGDALAAAHEKGIVHRDVKPENVFVTRDGRVKLLDFGLARHDEPPREGEAASPTLSLRTAPGCAVGTVSYMSPEQATGLSVDGRSDLFSLGVVLYEMLAGRRPFARETAPETLTAILREDPEPLETAAPNVAAPVRWVVARCLEKDPAQRFQAARDFVFALEAMRDVSSASIRGPGAGHRTGRRSGRVAASALGAAVCLGAAFLTGRSVPGGAPSRAARAPHLVRMTWEPGPEAFPNISPDGGSFAYEAGPHGKRDVFVRRVGGENAVNLTKDFPGDDSQPAFSPDGRTIAFRSERDGGGIFLMGATGESPRRLTDFGYEPAWSPEGGRIAICTQMTTTGSWGDRSEIWIVDVGTGARRRLYDRDGRSPSWSPSGSRIVFQQHPGVSLAGRHLLSTISVAGGEPTVVHELDGNLPPWPDWTKDGILFNGTEGGTPGLWRVRVDEANGKRLGEAEPVLLAPTWSVFPSSTPDGGMTLFASAQEGYEMECRDFDPVRGRLGTSPRTVLSGPRDVSIKGVSPDGGWLGTLLLEPHGMKDVLLVRVSTGETRRLTYDPLPKDDVVWAPDGTKLYFAVAPAGTNEVWSIRPDGGGRERVVPAQGKEGVSPGLASPDGRTLIVVVGDELRPGFVDLGVPIERRVPVPLPPTPEGRLFQAEAWSPDGQWLVGRVSPAPDAPRPPLYLFDVGRKAYEELLAREGIIVGWLPDSRRFLLVRSGELEVIDRVMRTVAAAGRLGDLARRPALSRDGRSLYTTNWNFDGDIWMLERPSQPKGN